MSCWPITLPIPSFVSWLRVIIIFEIFRLMTKRVQKLVKELNVLIHETLRLKRWCPSTWWESAKQTEAEHRVTCQCKPELSSSGSPLIRCHHCGILHKYHAVRKDEIWPAMAGHGKSWWCSHSTQIHTLHTLFNMHTQIKYKEGLSECEHCHLYLRRLPVASEARSTPLCQRITVYI